MRRLLVVAAVVLAGCSTGSSPSPAILLPSVGDGYSVSAVSGPLSRDSLVHATALPALDMSSFLRAAHLQHAAERVWTSGDGSFVTEVVTALATAAEAAALVARAAQVLPGPATRGFSVPGVRGARGFIQTSAVHGRTMFCVIAFMHVKASAFVVTRCTLTPQDTTYVTRLAQEQVHRVP